MLKQWCVGLALKYGLVLACGFSVSGAQAMTEEIPSASSLNKLGATLLVAHLESEGMDNTLVSPVSLYFALAIAREGAAGDSAALLERLLSTPDKSVSNAGPDLAQQLVHTEQNPNSTKGTFVLANALWSDNGDSSDHPFVFSAEFAQSVSERYLAQINEADFRASATANAVNDWAKRVTNGLIPRVIVPEALWDLSWLIINAAVFEGSWGTEVTRVPAYPDYQFTPLSGEAKSRDTILTTSYVSSVVEKESGGVAFKLPFAGRKYSLVVDFPGQSGVGELLHAAKQIPQTVGQVLNADSQRYQLSIVLPVFDFSDDIELRITDPQTRALGLVPLYLDSANFTAMSDERRSHPRVHHSKVGLIKQNARIELDEKGVSAAAVTVIGGMRATSVRPVQFPKKSIVVDRPFAFAIVENSSQAVLFQGVLVR